MLKASELRRMFGLFTIAEVADELGVKPSGFYYQVHSGHLPRPTTPYGDGCRCYYTIKDLKELKVRIRKPE